MVTTGEANLKGKAELWVYGNGRTGKVGPIALGSGKTGHFKVNATDQFKATINPNIGDIYKIRVGHLDTIAGDEWFLEKVEMQNIEQDETHEFWFQRWLSRGQEDFDVVRECPMESEGLEVLHYHINVKLGNQRPVKSDTKIHVELRGSRGDTGKRLLFHSLNNKKKFENAGQTDTFLVEAVDLDQPKEIWVGSNCDVPGHGFFIEMITVEVEHPEHGKKLWYFPCNKWFDKGEDDKIIERVIKVGERRTFSLSLFMFLVS